MRDAPLTEVQARVLDVLEGWQTRNGYPMSLRDMRKAFRVSMYQAQRYRLLLTERGFLKSNNGHYICTFKARKRGVAS